MKANQVLLKWNEGQNWYVIRRGPDGRDYRIEGYETQNTGLSVVPEFSFPFTQEEVASEFAKQNKNWRTEMNQEKMSA